MTQEKKNGNLVAIITMFFIFAMISFVPNLAARYRSGRAILVEYRGNRYGSFHDEQ